MPNQWGQPTSIWEALGQSLTQVGQSAQQWVPAMLRMQEQGSDAALNMWKLWNQMNPQATPEQRRQQAAILEQGLSKDPRYRGFKFPRETVTQQPNVMGPAAPSAPTPGVTSPFADVTPPAPGATPATPPPAPGGIDPFAATRKPEEAVPPMPPGIQVAPYTAPTRTEQISVPPQPLGQQTLSSRYANQPQILKALQDAGIPIDQPIEDVNAYYPHWASVVQLAGGGSQGRTWGDFFSYLRTKHPEIATQPMPPGYIDPKTGQPSAAAEAYLRANGYQPPSDYQVETEKDRKARSFGSLVTSVEEHIRNLDTAITRGHPGQIHTLVKERDDYVNAQAARLKKIAADLKAQGIDVSFEGLEYTHYSPQDLEAVTAGERGKTAQKTFATERAQAIRNLTALRTEAYRQLRARSTGGAAAAIRQYNQALEAANARLGSLAQSAGIDDASLPGFEPMSDQNLGTMTPPYAPSRRGGGALGTGRGGGGQPRPRTWNQPRYDAAITALRGERLRFGRDPATGAIKDPVQLNLAVERFLARATALGMDPANARRQAQAAIPEWQPSGGAGAMPPAGPSARPSGAIPAGPQRPQPPSQVAPPGGAVAPAMTGKTGPAPSSRAGTILQRYRQKPEPMPGSKFNLLTPDEQRWLTREGVAVDTDK